MRYVVTYWVDYTCCNQWRFENQNESLDFYKKKVDNLAKERKEDNKILNLENEDSYGYVWQDQLGRVLQYFKKWKDIKNED